MNTIWFRVTNDLAATAAWLRRTTCGLGGHAMMLHFERDRIALECMSCGEQTPGWKIHTSRA